MTACDPLWWVDAGAPTAPAQHPLPAECDVAIIGAGLTGLSAARTLARAGTSVLVLDAHAPGFGASSRNGGMVGGGHRLSYDQAAANFGADIAKRLLHEAHLDSGQFVLDLMAEENIDCDFAATGRFRALWKSHEYETTARELEVLQRHIPLEAGMLPRDLQRQEVASDLYRGGVIYYKHGGLNPAKWVAGLLQAAQRAGAVVQGNTPVTGVEPAGNEQAGAGFNVHSPRGAVRAGAVLVATNGYTPSHLGAYKRRIVPVPSFIIATQVLGQNRVRDLFPNARMIVESRERHCYFRPSPDGQRVVFGGRAAMFNAPEPLVRRQMRALLTQVFPQLSGTDLSHSWRGRTGFSFNYLPHVGQIDGLWHAMGYSGNGNTMAPWLGHKAALQILGDSDGETAFSHTVLPTRWWHRGPAWFMPFADLTFRGRDILNRQRPGD